MSVPTPVAAPPFGRSAVPASLWILATNALLLFGVLVLHWPVGNVLLLFWIENALLGVLTLGMILTARGETATSTKRTMNRAALAAFFCFHYGMFCLVHLGFVLPLSFSAGLQPSWWTLGIPALLVSVRYLAEFTSDWILRGERLRVHYLDCFGRPYPRVVVLHLVTLLGWFLMVGLLSRLFLRGSVNGGGGFPMLGGVLDWLAGLGVANPLAAAITLLLVVIKTVMEVGVASGRFRMSVDNATTGSD